MKESIEDIKACIQISAKIAQGLKLNGYPNRYWVMHLNKDITKAILAGISKKEIEEWIEDSREMARKQHEEEKAI